MFPISPSKPSDSPNPTVARPSGVISTKSDQAPQYLACHLSHITVGEAPTIQSLFLPAPPPLPIPHCCSTFRDSSELPCGPRAREGGWQICVKVQFWDWLGQESQCLLPAAPTYCFGQPPGGLQPLCQMHLVFGSAVSKRSLPSHLLNVPGAVSQDRHSHCHHLPPETLWGVLLTPTLSSVPEVEKAAAQNLSLGSKEARLWEPRCQDPGECSIILSDSTYKTQR